MRYSIKPRDKIYVEGYGFLPFAKDMGKNLSNKYGQKLLDSTKKSTTDSIKTASKRAHQKTAEATDDWIADKIADEVTSVSKKSDANSKMEASKRWYLSPVERQQIIDELSLV